MIKSTRLLMLLLALAAGLGVFNMSTLATGPTELITLCFRGKTIQAPFYLRFKYYGLGAVDGPCPISGP